MLFICVVSCTFKWEGFNLNSRFILYFLIDVINLQPLIELAFLKGLYSRKHDACMYIYIFRNEKNNIFCSNLPNMRQAKSCFSVFMKDHRLGPQLS